MPNPKSNARNPEAAQTDSKSMARVFDEIMNIPSPNPRYEGKTPIELVRMLLTPMQPSK